jgi:hypothetical protein
MQSASLRRSYVVAAAAVTLTGIPLSAGDSSACGGVVGQPAIDILVRDYAQLPRGVLMGAQEKVALVYRSIAIETTARLRRSSAARAGSSISTRPAPSFSTSCVRPERVLRVRTFFIMDETLLLYKKRPLELLQTARESLYRRRLWLCVRDQCRETAGAARRLGSRHDSNRMTCSRYFIPDQSPQPRPTGPTGAEGVAADGLGNVYGAEIGGGAQALKKYVRQ